MNSPHLHPTVTGAAMDKRIPRRHGRRLALAAAIVAALCAGAIGIARLLPSGVAVRAADVRIAPVQRGVFNDAIIVRSVAEPLHSVLLDSVESGKVEEVLAEDGAMVSKGQLLFRLSNPQRNLELLARQAERAQQLSNLSAMQVALEASRADRARRLSELRFAFGQAEKQHGRNLRLAQQGFFSAVALDESADRLAQQQRLLQDEEARGESDEKVKGAAVAQMQSAIRGLDRGLALVHATVDALAVRAPVAGRLTGMRLRVGESVRVAQEIGRIDDPDQFKLVAPVDEFYLARVAKGQRGTATLGGKSYPVEVSAAYPQIKDGRFMVDLVFSQQAPAALRPGQGLDTSIVLGDPAPALLLPVGAWVNDSGGSWVFAVRQDGIAERKAVRTGRRNSSQVEVLAGLAAGDRVIVSSYAAWANTPRLQLSK